MGELSRPARTMFYLFTFFFVIASASQLCPQITFDGLDTSDLECRVLKEEKFFFYWRLIEDENDGGKVVDMVMHVKNHSGYIGVGISESGGMKGADSFIYYPSDNSDPCRVHDYWNDHYNTPILDQHQHVTCHSSLQNNGDHSVWFSRFASTNDPFDNEIRFQPGAVQNLIWSLGKDYDLRYHGQDRGVLYIDFTSTPLPERPDVQSNPDLCSVTISAEDYSLPTEPMQRDGNSVTDPKDLYLYKAAKFAKSSSFNRCDRSDFQSQCPEGFITDDVNDEYHIIWSDGMQGAKYRHKYLHHVVLYGCEDLPSYYGEPKWKTEMGDACASMIGWSPGLDPFVTPPEAGMKIGGSSRQYFTLEMHFYNPYLHRDVVASAGYEIIISKKLRQFDIGMLTVSLGVLDKVFFCNAKLPATIAPLERDVVFGPDLCDLSCMGKEGFRDNVTVIGVVYHMHNTGYSGTMELIRDGKNLGPFLRQGRFDYNYQTFKYPEKDTMTLRPTDKILSYCSYNTMRSPADTSFGVNTNQEMCQQYIMYYPEQKLRLCGTPLNWDSNDFGPALTQEVFSSASPRYHIKPDPTWPQKKSLHKLTCSMQGDSMYSAVMPTIKRLCSGCRQNFSWAAQDQSCAALTSSGACPRCVCFGEDGPQIHKEGRCPAENTCTDDNYKHMIDDFKETKCEEFLAGTHFDVWQFCQVTREQNLLPQAVWTTSSWPTFEPLPMKEAVVTLNDDCKTHADCADNEYCVNGELAFTPAANFRRNGSEYFSVATATRNVCRQHSLCCENVDAVGPHGERERLYACPEEAQCTSWASKAYFCFMNNTLHAYCPAKDKNGRDFCIDTAAKQNCKDHCSSDSIMSGHALGPKMCVRKQDHDELGNYYYEVTDSEGGSPLTNSDAIIITRSDAFFFKAMYVPYILILYNVL